MDWKLELVAVPVSDVNRAKAPPGSACSIYIGTGLTKMKPGLIEGLQMVVPDIEKAHDQLAERGVDVSDIQDLAWGRFVYFSDPDGNKWAVQQLPQRG
jgi:uncharacterized glyoxalase superfamily protein PhnB